MNLLTSLCYQTTSGHHDIIMSMLIISRYQVPDITKGDHQWSGKCHQVSHMSTWVFNPLHHMWCTTGIILNLVIFNLVLTHKVLHHL